MKHFAIAILLGTSALAGCTAQGDVENTNGTEAADEQMQITGSVAYRERIALRPGGMVQVTLNDISLADAPSTVIAQQDIKLTGQQVPIAFTLNVDPDDLQPRRRYSVRGTITDADGNLRWTTDTATIVEAGGGDQDLGTLMMVAVGGNSGSNGNDSALMNMTRFTCGTASVQALFPNERAQAVARPEEKQLKLSVDGVSYQLDPVRAASGAKYEGGSNNGKVMFWDKGDKAMLSIGNKSYPECTRQKDGNQMTGTLTGGEWVVEDINNRGIIDRSRATLVFSKDGRLSGRSSCNNYSGQYEMDGMKLSVPGTFAVTRKACVPALMNQERDFLQIAEKLESYRFDNTGALILTDSEGRTLLARRQ